VGLLYWLAVRLWACFLVGTFLAASSTSAQTVNPFPANYPYLLRVEREADNTNTCVLLKKDGSYHYEKNHNDQYVTVYEGELTPESRENIERLLQQPDLLNVKQSALPAPAFAFDEVIVNVFRADHWQDLVFAGSKDRRSLVPTVSTLVDWLGSLPRLPHRELTEFEGRNNCLTEHKIELRVRPARPPQPVPNSPAAAEASPGQYSSSRNPSSDQASNTSAAGVSPVAPVAPPSFLLWISIVHFGEPMQRRCAMVYPDGRYHVEKTSQAAGAHAFSQVMEGTLPGAALDSLREITSAPEWQVEYEEQLPSEVMVLGGEMIEVRLPAPDGILRSAFMNVDYQKIGTELSRQIEDLATVPESHLRVISPLRAWYTKNLEDAKLPVVKSGVANLCEPD
jgi:hypothetical protein